MRACVQRVSQARVTVASRTVGEIGRGLLVLLGVGRDDDQTDVDYLAVKIAHLRIFADADGKMNRSLIDVSGQMLVVSQFTLLGDTRKGRRPSFVDAAGPEQGAELYEQFVRSARDLGLNVQTGQFQADMQVSLVNDGPVTIIIDSTQA